MHKVSGYRISLFLVCPLNQYPNTRVENSSSRECHPKKKVKASQAYEVVSEESQDFEVMIRTRQAY